MTAHKRDSILDRQTFLAGSQTLPIEEVLATFGRRVLTDKARDEMWDWFMRRPGLSMESSPMVVQPGDTVTLTHERGGSP